MFLFIYSLFVYYSLDIFNPASFLEASSGKTLEPSYLFEVHNDFYTLSEKNKTLKDYIENLEYYSLIEEADLKKSDLENIKTFLNFYKFTSKDFFKLSIENISSYVSDTLSTFYGKYYHNPSSFYLTDYYQKLWKDYLEKINSITKNYNLFFFYLISLGRDYKNKNTEILLDDIYKISKSLIDQTLELKGDFYAKYFDKIIIDNKDILFFFYRLIFEIQFKGKISEEFLLRVDPNSNFLKKGNDNSPFQVYFKGHFFNTEFLEKRRNILNAYKEEIESATNKRFFLKNLKENPYYIYCIFLLNLIYFDLKENIQEINLIKKQPEAIIQNWIHNKILRYRNFLSDGLKEDKDFEDPTKEKEKIESYINIFYIWYKEKHSYSYFYSHRFKNFIENYPKERFIPLLKEFFNNESYLMLIKFEPEEIKKLLYHIFPVFINFFYKLENLKSTLEVLKEVLTIVNTENRFFYTIK